MSRGDYASAEEKFKGALNAWRNGSGSRQEEARFVDVLGKCYVAQRKYEDAYALYSEALGYLTGTAYDEIYTSFLYLNERMGTFTKKDTDGP
jgi:tetratricopeptide (TPR) repeat protein